ncbi:MAG: ribosome recycling factor [Anaerophaga sp.]|uniref:ribosome recycling factor n=1 Tax=Anaerophaga thermohalophila TaxID=177400 RepID=UPI000237D19B|nr:ribosome recycling factor [Anaerophaga thermohalophila]MBZ4676330.1 ribosome recycling factor [Anaerophaga sp.]MDK2840632.1 ribosome recycling factor [Anaerophaga sp.]MDN5290925.1 ribosome recycling factor [Anaerophaga sp.]
MEDDVQILIESTKEKMQKAIDHLDHELGKIRAGKANPRMLDDVMVEYYGTMTPLQQVASINTPDPRTIAIQPWEKGMIQPIEKAIMNANLGLNPDNNGEIVRINVPPLTEERRQDLVKHVKKEGEEARISIRNARRETNDELKKLKKDGLPEDMEKDAEDQVQKLTDKFTKKVEEMLEKKEKDIMTV